MFAPAIFLVIFALAVVVMVLFRVWEIRVGRISVPEGKVPEKFISADQIEMEAEMFFKKARIFFIHTTVFLLSRLIIVVRNAFEVIRKELSKLSERLPKRFPHYLEHSGGSSVFLKDISAHKDEVRRENGYHPE